MVTIGDVSNKLCPGPPVPDGPTVTNPPLRIPFNRPTHTRLVDEYVAQALHSGHISGDGDFTRRCQELLGALLEDATILLTTSGTHALELMALLLDIGPGDEVIVPSFTFSSTVNAFVLRGATPVFIDIRRDTLNLDENKLDSLITPRTRAIVPVHYAGVACEMDPIMEIAGRHDVTVVEDNAHGLFGEYRGKPLGTFGVMAAQSFHETKNFSCGEGGAIVINDPRYVERAEIIREKGTDRRKFFRGLVDKYTWVDIGSSYLPSDLLAAMLLAQLEDREWVWEHRSTVWNRYAAELTAWSRANRVQMPFVPEHCRTPYHLFHMIMPSTQARDGLIDHLRAAGILAVFHYQPLHLSPFGQRVQPVSDCPVTEDIAMRLVRLPFYTNMQETDVDAVIEFSLQLRRRAVIPMMETKRVILSAIEPEHVAAIVRWRNLPEVHRGFIEYEPLGTAQQAAFLAGLTANGSRRTLAHQCPKGTQRPPSRARGHGRHHGSRLAKSALRVRPDLHRRIGPSRRGPRQGRRGSRAGLLLQPSRVAQGHRACHREQRGGHPIP